MAAGTGHARSVTARSRRGLSRPVVLEAALRLADAEGLEAMTMSRLAAELGVGTMTLYGYYRSRDELLDAVCTALLDRVAPPPPGADDDWTAQLCGLLSAWRDVLAAHPAAVGHLMGRPVVSAGTLRPVDAALGLLRAGGLDEVAAVRAFVALFAHTLGCAFLSLDRRRSGGTEADPELAVRRLQAEALSAGLRHVADSAPELVAAMAEDPLPGGVDRILERFVGGRGAAGPSGATA